LALALITLAALGIRLLYIFLIARSPIGVGGDAGFYHSAANEIADGHFYYRVIFGHAYSTAEHPPLYPLVLSVSSLLGAKSLLAHRLVSCGIGCALVALVGLLGRRLGGGRAGIVAASIAAVYPPFVTADGLVMSEPLFAAIVAAALLVALRLRERPSLGGSALLGLAIGLASLTRAEALALVPLLAWPASLRPSTGRLARVLVATLATALVVSPWVLRNAVVFHRAMFAADSNTVIAGAQCHDAYYGHDIGWWSYDCFVRARTKTQIREGDASTTQALHFARTHLTRLPLVAAVRVLRTFDLFQPLRQGNREPRRKWLDWVGLGFVYPLYVLAGFGLARVRGRRWILLAPVWMVVIVSALAWGIGRFRIGADVSIVVLAAVALAAWTARARSGERATPTAVRSGRPRAPAPAA
jgi:4-amino-4-deoxy-L-arabinose transferase-like glycosyltransferase